MNDERTIDGGDEWTAVCKGTILYGYESYGYVYSVLVESANEYEVWGFGSYGGSGVVRCYDRRDLYLTKGLAENAAKEDAIRIKERNKERERIAKIVDEAVDSKLCKRNEPMITLPKPTIPPNEYLITGFVVVIAFVILGCVIHCIKYH